jgi:putative heme-binding domain-containing protein
MRSVIILLTALIADGQPPDGKKLFAVNCSVGYCHGAEGRAGRGPRLRDREWDRNYLFKVIDGGIANSSMPAWHERLSGEQISSIIEYILSISKEVTHSDSPPTVAGAGKNLFFDATNERNCGVCHKAGGMGGDVGPDLGSVASLAAREILNRMRAPNGKGVEIKMKDGETIRGVIAEENANKVRIYDLSSPGPPVARTIAVGDIAQRRAASAGMVHEHLDSTYTKKQLADLIGFVKSAPVQVEDLF